MVSYSLQSTEQIAFGLFLINPGNRRLVKDAIEEMNRYLLSTKELPN